MAPKEHGTGTYRCSRCEKLFNSFAEMRHDVAEVHSKEMCMREQNRVSELNRKEEARKEQRQREEKNKNLAKEMQKKKEKKQKQKQNQDEKKEKKKSGSKKGDRK